jgi:hypothetical protein
MFGHPVDHLRAGFIGKFDQVEDGHRPLLSWIADCGFQIADSFSGVVTPMAPISLLSRV